MLVNPVVFTPGRLCSWWDIAWSKSGYTTTSKSWSSKMVE